MRRDFVLDTSPITPYRHNDPGMARCDICENMMLSKD